MSAVPDRVVALDVVRGMAVMGILLLNIVDFALPRCAYVDPACYRASTADWWTWAAMFVLADGKMRGLFTMLFGASAVLVATRATAAGRAPLRVHYARMATLLAIGMVHGWLIWSGDILVLYALAGMLLYPLLRLPTRGLLAIAAILMAAQVITGAVAYHGAQRFAAAASAPDATAETRARWRHFVAAIYPTPDEIAAEVRTQRGGWAAVLPARFVRTAEAQAGIFALLPETIALMLIGIALFRSGFFSGAWPRRRYWQVIGVGYGIALPLYLPLVAWMDAAGFDPLALLLSDPVHLVVLRPWVALAHAAAVILLVGSGRAAWLVARVAGVGRAALSNYLGSSVVCTLLFCGFGLGLFGQLARWQLYFVVALLWVAMLAWSRRWLNRFAQGPAEALWRRMARTLG